MRSDLKWKIPLILIVLAVAGWYLFRPGVPLEERINLGLDLQGGFHLVLEVQTDKAVQNEVIRAKSLLENDLKEANIPYQVISVDPENQLRVRLQDMEAKGEIEKIIQNDYPDFYKIEGSETNGELIFGLDDRIIRRTQENAVKQAHKTMRNRIDQFGVREPVIQRTGDKRIIVELAGVDDPQRAKSLIGKTAQLKFQLVIDSGASKEGLLKNHNGKVPEGAEIVKRQDVEAEEQVQLSSYFLLEKEAKVTGADLKDARVTRDEFNLPAVSFEFGREGARKFGELTSANIDKGLAIVLDNRVQSAPVIRSRITDQGQITGNFTMEEATDLAIVLRAGALPAPVEILEDRTVGPSLGKDSIKLGKNAIILGGALVIIFMTLYYKVSGIIANLTLFINFFIIMGTLAGFKATLTLPGIAGLVLTVGMAVDANVLIFERIREELRLGKTVRAAVESGFSKAFRTIMDANITTLIAAVVLLQFGTGPIKGFAVTLSIGIVSTLFTALLILKVIFDLMLRGRSVKRLSI